MFAVDYTSYPVGNDPNPIGKEAARPAKVASITWSGPSGVVDGIEGDHRLTGQILAFDRTESVKVMLRPGKDGRSTVFGSAATLIDGGGGLLQLSVATLDPAGVAVVTGRQPSLQRGAPKRGQEPRTLMDSPVAAGILPAGASDIGVILTTNEIASGLPASERLPDGRVIFAIKAEGDQTSSPKKDSIKAVTWTNADGSPGRKDVTQHEAV